MVTVKRREISFDCVSAKCEEWKKIQDDKNYTKSGEKAIL